MSNSLLVDVHAHLSYKPLIDDISNVIDRAEKAGVKYVVSNGTNAEANRQNLELSRKFQIVKCAFGYFPDYIAEDGFEKFMREFEWIKKQKEIFALGEIGLDFAKHKDNADMIKGFEEIVNFGVRKNIPLIVHSRKAERKVVEMLDSLGAKKVCLHFFCGKKSLIKKGIELGWFFSIPTNIVKSSQLQSNARFIPITQILSETDAPWLSPFNAGTNEPAFVAECVKKIAELKKMDVAEVQNSIFMNFQNLFLRRILS